MSVDFAELEKALNEERLEKIRKLAGKISNCCVGHDIATVLLACLSVVNDTFTGLVAKKYGVDKTADYQNETWDQIKEITKFFADMSVKKLNFWPWSIIAAFNGLVGNLVTLSLVRNENGEKDLSTNNKD